jgi:hypothetical protein
MNSIFICNLLFFKNSNFLSHCPYHLITYSNFQSISKTYFFPLLILQLSLTVSLSIFLNLLQLQLIHYLYPLAPWSYYLTLIFQNSTINLFCQVIFVSYHLLFPFFPPIHLLFYHAPINCIFLPILHTFYTQLNSYSITTCNRFVSFDIKIIFCLFKHLILRCYFLRCFFIIVMSRFSHLMARLVLLVPLVDFLFMNSFCLFHLIIFISIILFTTAMQSGPIILVIYWTFSHLLKYCLSLRFYTFPPLPQAHQSSSSSFIPILNTFLTVPSILSISSDFYSTLLTNNLSYSP